LAHMDPHGKKGYAPSATPGAQEIPTVKNPEL
jgi:hypothetical protein